MGLLGDVGGFRKSGYLLGVLIFRESYDFVDYIRVPFLVNSHVK